MCGAGRNRRSASGEAQGILHPTGAEWVPEVKLSATILARDARFWTAFNACTFDHVDELITRNVEFCHDKGGPTLGFPALLNSLKDNLCGPGSRLRRDVVAGTLKVFPLRNGAEIYGAILSGEHVLYVTLPGKQEFLDGRANFTHLWLKEDGVFKIARLLSFAHRPAVER